LGLVGRYGDVVALVCFGLTSGARVGKVWAPHAGGKNRKTTSGTKEATI